MNDDFVSLYTYVRWADRKILEGCRKLSPEQYVAEPAPGWASVRATLVHLAVVTEGWLRGLTGEEVGQGLTEADLPTLAEAARWLERAYGHVDGLLAGMTPEWLATPMNLRGGGRSAVLPPWVVLRHVANHGTYHRGQIASKLKRFGVDPPQTDFVFWAFEKLAAAPK